MQQDEQQMSATLPAHDGEVYGGEELNEASVTFDPAWVDYPVCISGGHGHYDSDAVFLNARQALTLLEWLRQLEETLKQSVQDNSTQEC